MTVAPRGNVKLATLFETPSLTSTAYIVRGSVAFDDDVENAVSSGVAMFLRCFSGLALPSILTDKGRVINP